MTDLSTVLGAISHPSRRAIMARLANGPARVTEIAAPFDRSLNSVSKHLKVLEQAGLIHRERKGRDHVIELRAEPLREVVAWAHEYERFWNGRLDRLEQFFKEKGFAPMVVERVEAAAADSNRRTSSDDFRGKAREKRDGRK